MVKSQVDKELEESIKGIARLHQKIIEKSSNINEEISILRKDIKRLIKDKDEKKIRLKLLTRFCLLSELCGAVDFNEMIKAREMFLQIYPEHFKSYLNHLDKKEWEISWSACLGCLNFTQKCNLGIHPRETREEGKINYYCPSFVPRKKGL